MLDEDQISFSFASSMVDDNIEDYSHQIAEMIGLRNESYLVQAGVSENHFQLKKIPLLMIPNWHSFRCI